MKFILNIFILSFCTSITFSQQKTQNRVVYSATLGINNAKVDKYFKDKEELTLVKEKMKDILKKEKGINYILNFTGKESVFTKENSMSTTGKISIVEISAGKGLFYFNKKTGEMLEQKESFGEQFLIRYPKTNWTLTQEKKKIGKYICYKATAKKKVEGRMGVIYKPVIAWYTPQLPFNFGPKEFSGLPGLILVLTEGNLTFSATNIELNTRVKKNTIKKPIKGKRVTLEEHKKLMEKIFVKSRMRN